MKRQYIYIILLSVVSVCTAFAQPAYDFSKLKREKLGRGLVAIRDSENSVTLSWRYLSSDPMNTAFNVYRNGKKIAEVAANAATFYQDKNNGKKDVTYSVKPVIDGKETAQPQGNYRLKANAPIGYLNIPIERPADGVTPSGDKYSYSANDASVGDVDGDGEYEIVLKWEPSNAHDNAHDGYTGNVYFDCYRLTGEKLWRIDMGRNIRTGAHYTQFIVYDLDGDGKAEMVAKTSDGTIDGQGKVIGDPAADYREAGVSIPDDQRDRYNRGRRSLHNQGRILTGNEYLTIFNGKTGAAMQTIDYVPQRGRVEDWGDDRANRSDRYLACVAYLDGEHPSVVMCRGYYTRATLAAFDWDGKQLKQRWLFDSNDTGHERFAGQGNHNLRVGDVDGDGCDEIVYGSCTIDHDGRGLYSTGLGHGDAMHMTQFAPGMKGFQVWDCHENRRDGSSFRDAATGQIIFQIPDHTDVGRCMAADIDPTNPGVEMWSISPGAMYNIKGEKLRDLPSRMSINMAVWWDGDLLRELLDHNTVSKYNWETGVCEPLTSFEGCTFNNGSKSNPCLQGDILGDWREEVIVRTNDNAELRLYVSPIPTDYRFHTFLEDPVYRISIATENVCYNQPTQPGFYFGPDLKNCIFRGYEFGDDSSTINDTNTPLHLLQPNYKVPYGELTVEDVKGKIDCVLHYLEKCTPAELEDGHLKQGTFRLTSYEWGVTYWAMLDAAEATGDDSYFNYVKDRQTFLARIFPDFREKHKKGEKIDNLIRRVIEPHALDDCGAICASMIMSLQHDNTLPLRPLIDNYMDFILNKEYRLEDGTLARTRPHHNTIWLDDMFMGIPPIALYSLVDTDRKEELLNEAARQVMLFAERMWLPEKKLFRHGWVEEMQVHPAYHWGRANGWALLTLCKVLDVLPPEHPKYGEILELFRDHVSGISSLQNGDGFWHQLLDRNDSYPETSCTAIFVYCIAHGINRGWLDPLAYGPVAQLGWHAVSTKVNPKGQVEDVCVGTGMGFDPAFYYYRPVSPFAAHGYGPAIWAGAEMIRLLNNHYPKMNDSAIHYYRTEQKTSAPIFSEQREGIEERNIIY